MDFWRQQRVLVTGGGGFFGSHVVEQIKKRRPAALSVPRHKEYDLRRLDRIEALLKKEKPDLILNLAAVCGGIGANRAQPGRFFYDNIVMGVQLMDAARRFNIKKFLQVGTVCSYPKFTPVPFKENDL